MTRRLSIILVHYPINKPLYRGIVWNIPLPFHHISINYHYAITVIIVAFKLIANNN